MLGKTLQVHVSLHGGVHIIKCPEWFAKYTYASMRNVNISLRIATIIAFVVLSKIDSLSHMQHYRYNESNRHVSLTSADYPT